jgi:L,D-transpeptidase YcbB
MRPSCEYVSSQTLVPFFGTFLLAVDCCYQPATDAASDPGQMNLHTGAKPDQTKSELRAVIDDGRLQGLRWPNFAKFRALLAGLYQRSNFSPIWIREGQPTSQAEQMIALLQQADNDGLVAGDYDSSLWPQQLARLETAHTGSDEARFDVALTVSTMRCVSDVSAGRINPRYFHLPLDLSRKDLDLSRFVQTRLADGTDLITDC